MGLIKFSAYAFNMSTDRLSFEEAFFSDTMWSIEACLVLGRVVSLIIIGVAYYLLLVHHIMVVTLNQLISKQKADC